MKRKLWSYLLIAVLLLQFFPVETQADGRNGYQIQSFEEV